MIKTFYFHARKLVEKQFLFINGGHWQDNPSWCHSDAIILSVSTHIKEDGIAYLEKADDYKKYVTKE